MKNDDFDALIAVFPQLKDGETYDLLLKAEKQLQAMKAQGLKTRHPNIVLQRATIDDIRMSLVDQVSKASDSLKDRWKVTNHRIEKLKEIRCQSQKQGTAAYQLIQRLNTARKKYETARSAAEQLQLTYDSEITRLAPEPSWVVLLEPPEFPSQPVTKGRNFVAGFVVLVSLPFSIAGGIALMFLAEAVFPRK